MILRCMQLNIIILLKLHLMHLKLCNHQISTNVSWGTLMGLHQWHIWRYTSAQMRWTAHHSHIPPCRTNCRVITWGSRGWCLHWWRQTQVELEGTLWEKRGFHFHDGVLGWVMQGTWPQLSACRHHQGMLRAILNVSHDLTANHS